MSFFAELKRRNVFRVGIAYLVGGWLLLQLAEVLAELLDLPDVVGRIVVLIVVLGLPIALFFAWAFELTPEGIKREREVDRSQSITAQTGRKLDFIIIGVLAVALAYFVADKFLLQPDVQQAAAEPVATDEQQTGPRSIAVLPLVNMSPDAENEYFSDGLTEELLNILARIKELQVAGRTSSFAFKGQNLDLRDIAAKLNVDSILEGSVRKDAQRVRITLQLINAENGYHLWSETYDRDLEDIFTVQEEIAREVAAALRVTLLGEDEQRIQQQARTDLNAYDLYLQGLQSLNQFTYSSLPEAAQTFQQAIAIDPGYLPAHLGKAQAWISMSFTGAIAAAEVTEKAMPIIERALAEDPGNDIAHTLKALLFRLSNEDARAREELQRALDNNPRNALALAILGRSWFDWGQVDRGMEYLREAERIDPYSPLVLWHMTFTHAVMQESDKAMAFAQRIAVTQPENPNQFWGPAVALIINGDLAQSIPYQIKAYELDPDDYENPAGLAQQWLDLGDVEQAEYWARIADSLGADQPLPIKARVLMHQYREQYGLAADLAKRALDRELDNRQRSDAVFRRAWVSQLIRRGEAAAALDWYRASWPDLFEVPPGYDLDVPFDAEQLVEIAEVLLVLDPKSEQAMDFLDAAEQKESLRQSTQFPWQRIMRRAEIAAARGRDDEAMDLLMQAYDRGMRVAWREQLLVWVAFKDLRDEPDFKRLIAMLEEDMDRQREQAYELVGAGP